jgi:pimeloyl-ACP methyl ester carboxylesterase
MTATPAPTTARAALPSTLVAAEDALLRTVGIPVRRGEVSVDGIRLHYLTCGADDADAPLVLLHGRGSAAGMFAPIFAQLATRRRVYALDLPGWGLSEKPPFTGATAQDALDLWVRGTMGFLDALGLTQVDLLGHSMGGFTAMGLALHAPRRVRRLMLANPGGVGSRPARLDARLYFRLGPERLNRWLGRRFSEAITALAFPRDETPARALLDFGFAVAAQREVIASGARAFDTWSGLGGPRLWLTNRLGELAMPALLLWGERDFITPYANALEVAPRLRDGQLVTFASAGHAPFQERPDDFARVLNDWLDDEEIPALV